MQKTVNGLRLLTIFAKRSILDCWHGSEYASAFENFFAERKPDFDKNAKSDFGKYLNFLLNIKKQASKGSLKHSVLRMSSIT